MNLKEDYHIHTNYNDHSAANLTVKNVIKEAEGKGLELIALTEHVRKTSEWVSEYLNEIEELAKLINKHKKIVEVNAKYKLPPENWIKAFSKNGVKFHLGSDAHSLNEIGNYESIIKMIKLIA